MLILHSIYVRLKDGKMTPRFNGPQKLPTLSESSNLKATTPSLSYIRDRALSFRSHRDPLTI